LSISTFQTEAELERKLKRTRENQNKKDLSSAGQECVEMLFVRQATILHGVSCNLVWGRANAPRLHPILPSCEFHVLVALDTSLTVVGGASVCGSGCHVTSQKDCAKLKQQIIDAVDDTHITELKRAALACARCSAADLLDHLVAPAAKPRTTTSCETSTSLQLTGPPDTPIEQLWIRMIVLSFFSFLSFFRAWVH
jgi:hypothetical protein